MSVHAEGVGTPAVHHWPHIIPTQGATVFEVAGIPITTTILSTWIFMAILFVFVAILYIAIRSNAFPKIRTFWLDVISRIDLFLTDTVGSKKVARRFFAILAGFFLFILWGNIFGLIFDWINLSFPSMHSYLRPFNSDLNTTLVMAVSVILLVQITGIVYRGSLSHIKHYVFNFSGKSIVEKIINVPVGWIHFIGEFTRIISLSVRLFANIFAGVALIAVIAYLGTLIPIGPFGWILLLPFWFFELLVAFLQAFIFMVLSAVYFQEATAADH